MSRLRRKLLECPRWQAIAGITGVSIAGSVACTSIVVHFWSNEIRWMPSLLVAVLIPSIVAPIVSWLLLGVMHELESARSEAVRLANTDLLTGVLNRRRFFEIAESEFRPAAGRTPGSAVIMLDVDDFKAINDYYGHRTGDEVLKMIARRCGGALRATDHLVRWGGEEFVALMPNATSTEALSIARRLCTAISEGPLRLPAGELLVTASVGVASAGELGVGSLNQLLAMADRAMYEVKRSGKNDVMAAGDQHRTGRYAARQPLKPLATT